MKLRIGPTWIRRFNFFRSFPLQIGDFVFGGFHFHLHDVNKETIVVLKIHLNKIQKQRNIKTGPKT